jgi:hypothetical protein
MKRRDIGKVLLLFVLVLGVGRLAAIASDDADSMTCDNGVVEIVQDKCGEPDKKEGNMWRYNPGPAEPVYTLMFDQNGNLVRIVEDQGGS